MAEFLIANGPLLKLNNSYIHPKPLSPIQPRIHPPSGRSDLPISLGFSWFIVWLVSRVERIMTYNDPSQARSYEVAACRRPSIPHLEDPASYRSPVEVTWDSLESQYLL